MRAEFFGIHKTTRKLDFLLNFCVLPRQKEKKFRTSRSNKKNYCGIQTSTWTGSRLRSLDTTRSKKNTSLKVRNLWSCCKRALWCAEVNFLQFLRPDLGDIEAVLPQFVREESCIRSAMLHSKYVSLGFNKTPNLSGFSSGTFFKMPFTAYPWVSCLKVDAIVTACLWLESKDHCLSVTLLGS